MAKSKSKKRPSQTWKEKDRYPVIFWVAGKIKRGLIARSRSEKVSRAALFRAWAEAGFPVKRANASKPKKKTSKPKAARPNGAAAARDLVADATA